MTSSNDHSFYEKVRDEHAQLNLLLSDANKLLVERSAPLHEAIALLADLRNHLKQHFADEEMGGYFVEVVERAPWMAERTEALHREHPEMLKAIDALLHTARECDESAAWWEHIGEQFTALHKKITAHEAGEDDLVQEAFTQDIGSKD